MFINVKYVKKINIIIITSPFFVTTFHLNFKNYLELLILVPAAMSCYLVKKKINKTKQANINHTHIKSSTPLVSYRNKEFILSFHGHV